MGARFRRRPQKNCGEYRALEKGGAVRRRGTGVRACWLMFYGESLRVNQSTGFADRTVSVWPIATALVVNCMAALGYVIAREPYLHAWRAMGDIDAGAALLVTGAVLYPLATVRASRDAPSEALGARMHFRQSLMPYMVIGAGALVALLTRSEAGGSLGFAAGLLGIAAAVVAVVLNGLTITVLRILWRRHRSHV